MADATTVRASKEAVTALRRLAGTLSAQTGERVSLGDALAAAVTLAARDIPAAIAALPGRKP